MAEIERLLPINEVCAMVGRGRASLYRDIQNGEFPPPVRLGGSARWPLSEVQGFIRSVVAEQRNGEHRAA